MPKKLKKTTKKIKVVTHQSFKRTTHHTDDLAKKIMFPLIAIIIFILGYAFYKSMLVSPDINVISPGGNGGNVRQCDYKQKHLEGKSITKTYIDEYYCINYKYVKVRVPTNKK